MRSRRVKEIPLALGHLAAFDQQVFAVHPEPARSGSAGHALALRDLRLVVGKNVVLAAAMDIHLRPEDAGGHGAALDVPRRDDRDPRAFPQDVAIRLVPRLPKREIADLFLLVFVAA